MGIKFLVLSGGLLSAVLGLAAPEAKYLTLKKIPPIAIRAGQSAEVKISAVVDKGLHVQSNPAGAANLIPTTLELASKDGITTGTVVYPTGKPHAVAGMGNVPTYDETFSIKVPIKAAGDVKKGTTITLEGKLRYQACSEKTCFFPMTLPVNVPVVVK